MAFLAGALSPVPLHRSCVACRNENGVHCCRRVIPCRGVPLMRAGLFFVSLRVVQAIESMSEAPSAKQPKSILIYT